MAMARTSALSALALKPRVRMPSLTVTLRVSTKAALAPTVA